VLADHVGRRLVASKGRALATAAGLLALVPCPASAAQGPTFRVERGEVRITVPLRPGGAFEARTTSLSGSVVLGAGKPLPLTGDLSVDLASIGTGIGLRDQHLREKYLEVAKGPGFDTAVLSDLRLSDADGEGFEGRTGFSGLLLLHGVKRAVSGTGEIRRAGTAVHVEATFRLTLTDFGIEPPEYLGVGVANRLLVKVQLFAAPAGGASP
jgi:polyisoprenoid-binding protein YceI